MIGSIAIPSDPPVEAKRRLTRGVLGGVLVAFLLGYLAACAVPISYYDGTTYKNLTDLKAESTMLIDSFDTTPVARNNDAIDALMLNFRKAYEYERGKGEPNSDTMRQFAKIQELLSADVADYRKHGPGGLGRKYFSEAAVVLGQAFDIVIATENAKNRDKQ